MGPRGRGVLIGAGVLCVLGVAASGRVVLRGGFVEEGEIVGMSVSGLEVGGDAARVIGWDAVLRVEGARGEEARAYAGLAVSLSRAARRLERGDVGLAAPLYAVLYGRYGAVGGPTGRAVSEGELACRLAVGDQAGGVEPWLSALDARLGGARLTGGSMARTVIDGETGLVVTLPPVFASGDGEGLRALAGTSRWEATASRDVGERGLRAMAAGYRVAGAMAAGREVALDLEVLGAGLDGVELSGLGLSGVGLVRDMVVAEAGDAGARAAARERLSREAERHAGTWREAWARAAIGRSLLRSEDGGERRRGVVELMHVPARFMRTQPYLAGVCLADAAGALEADGLGGAAAVLRAELERALPGHPAIVGVGERAGVEVGGVGEATSEGAR